MAKAYKLFRIKKTEPDKIFPLFVDADTEIPFGKWIEAKCGKRTNNGNNRRNTNRIFSKYSSDKSMER